MGSVLFPSSSSTLDTLSSPNLIQVSPAMSEDFETRKTINEIDNEDMLANDVSQGRPQVGMQFPTDDDAVAFYKEYAMRMGFSIRKESAKRSRPDEPISRRYLVCYKAAYRRKPESERAKKRIGQNEEGCQARMAIHLKDGAWIIKQFFDQHNHEMVSPPNKSRKLSSQTKQHLQPCERELEDQHSKARSGSSETARPLDAASKETDEVTPLEAWNLQKGFDEIYERAIKNRVLYNATLVMLEDLRNKLGIIGTTQERPSVEQHEQFSSTPVISEGVLSTNITIWDPQKAKTKERPKESMKIQSNEEVSQGETQKRSRTCGVCHDKGHNSRTCPVKERAKEKV